MLALSIMTKPGGNRFTEQKIFSFFFHTETPGSPIRLPGVLVSQRKIYFLVRYLRISMAHAIRMTRPLMM